MITKTTIDSTLNKLSLICIFAFLLLACKKEVVEPTPDPDPVDNGIFNKLIRVNNFGENLPVGDEPTTKQPPMIYSLEENKAVVVDYIRTARWDIAFSDIYRSFISGNNSTGLGNFGAGGPGKGGVYLLEKKFDEVIDIPADGLFKTGLAVYGTDISGAFGDGLGWYQYDFDGTLRSDGRYEKQHVAYPIENRTVIVRTAKGNYAKIRMLSIYKDELNPDKWFRDSPAPYFTFDYVLVKAGSTKFEIK